jgi:hypothetical protein
MITTTKLPKTPQTKAVDEDGRPILSLVPRDGLRPDNIRPPQRHTCCRRALASVTATMPKRRPTALQRADAGITDKRHHLRPSTAARSAGHATLVAAAAAERRPSERGLAAAERWRRKVGLLRHAMRRAFSRGGGRETEKREEEREERRRGGPKNDAGCRALTARAERAAAAMRGWSPSIHSKRRRFGGSRTVRSPGVVGAARDDALRRRNTE